MLFFILLFKQKNKSEKILDEENFNKLVYTILDTEIYIRKKAESLTSLASGIARRI